MLHHPRQVTEPEVDELDAFGGDELEDLMGGALFHSCSLDSSDPGTVDAAGSADTT